jgi:hypothetical protein
LPLSQESLEVFLTAYSAERCNRYIGARYAASTPSENCIVALQQFS